MTRYSTFEVFLQFWNKKNDWFWVEFIIEFDTFAIFHEFSRTILYFGKLSNLSVTKTSIFGSFLFKLFVNIRLIVWSFVRISVRFCNKPCCRTTPRCFFLLHESTPPHLVAGTCDGWKETCLSTSILYYVEHTISFLIVLPHIITLFRSFENRCIASVETYREA